MRTGLDKVWDESKNGDETDEDKNGDNDNDGWIKVEWM